MTVDTGKDQTILVVEDDRLLRQVAVETLTEEGYSAVGTDNADAALETLQALPTVSLLITDVNMPGMSGLELVWLVHERYPMLQLLVISGRERIDTKSLPVNASFLGKPFTARMFLDEVKRLLDPLST